MIPRKVIALDFDGVVADTENECYMICLPAFRRMGEKIEDNERVRREFRKARPYVKIADDYYTVLKMIQKGSDFSKVTASEFSVEKKKDEEKGRVFHKLFYDERANLQKNMKKWISLNPPFPGVPLIVKRLIKKYPLIIVTAKDNISTMALLDNYGIKVSEENILPKARDKKEQMRFIAQKFGISYRDIIFIEDNFGHLTNVKDLGVKLVLVSWGYGTQEEKKQARKIGIKVANKKNLESIVIRI